MRSAGHLQGQWPNYDEMLEYESGYMTDAELLRFSDRASQLSVSCHRLFRPLDGARKCAVESARGYSSQRATPTSQRPQLQYSGPHTSTCCLA